MIHKSIEWRVWGGGSARVEDRAVELADCRQVLRSERRVSSDSTGSEKREQRSEDGVSRRHVIEAPAGRRTGGVAKPENCVEIVRHKLRTTLTASGWDEVYAVVVIFTVGNVGLEVLQDGHHCEPARPLIEVCHGLEGCDFRTGESCVIPKPIAKQRGTGAGRRVIEWRAGEVRRCDGLHSRKKTGQIGPVIGGGVILFAPAVQRAVRVGWHGPSCVAPVSIGAALLVEITTIGFRPMFIDQFTALIFDADPFPEIRSGSD